MLYVIIGTKGQLIKMLPILKELDRRKIEYNFIDAAQHVGIIQEISKQFNLKKPDYVLYNFNKDITGIFQIVRWFFKNIFMSIFKKKEIFKTGGYCMLHGDAPPATLGLLMCKLAGIKIVHVEAGERTYDIFNPFPEEISRRIIDKFSHIMFVETERTYKNLLREKVKGKIYRLEFNTLIDTVNMALKKKKKLNKEPYVLFSIHRFEAITSKIRLKFIVDVVKKISKDYHVVFVLHEPTKRNLKKFNLLSELTENKNVELLPLQDYFSFISLIDNSVFMVTDGGGPQREAYIMNKPCLLVRKISEKSYPNDFNAGFNLSKVDYFLQNYKKLKSDFKITESPSKRIVDVLEKLPGVKKTS